MKSKEPQEKSSLLRNAIRVIEIRFRFVLLVGFLLGISMTWNWLKFGIENLTSRFIPHHQHTTVSADSEFFCPMDPGVVSVWPSICPICKMDLIPRKKSDGILLPNGVVSRMQFSPYRISLAGMRTIPVEKTQNDGEWIVPSTSLVYRGDEVQVFIESIPGMLDAIPIQVRASGDNKTTLASKTLKQGDNVVVMGTLLVDAENRLNPNLSTQYFGAAGQLAATSAIRPPAPSELKSKTLLLTPEEQAIVLAQKFCPVTKAQLGSMGSPRFVTVQDRQIAICCEGCRKRLSDSPEKYLKWLDSKLAESTEE